MYIRTVITLIGTLFAWHSAHSSVVSQHAVDDSLISTLAESREWLALGHYQPNRLSSGYKSQADDPDFFLAPDGETSPEAELRATLAAIQAPVNGDANGHASCEFPARDRWLRQQLALPDPGADCTDFRQWKAELNTESVALVFAASYLNSPSSMFGHTFLRLDPPSDDSEANLLLANTISYAADAAERDNELTFAYRGIFGGYPGITSVRPYYEMIRLYSDIENRDLWEYQLNLTQSEVDQMLAHAWEIQDRNFDYYFFDENCAYRLLALIDVARPGTNLLDEVFTHAIPADTVRWVVDRDLVAAVNYRPSAATQVNHALSQLSPEHRRLASAIANGYVEANGTEMEELSAREQANVLDATYDYVRYQSEAEGWPRDYAAPLSHELLRSRSQIRDQAPLDPPPTPAVRDDQGHETFRAGLSWGNTGHRHYTELSLRPAYHDVLDPPEGYRPGAQLQFLRFDSRFYPDKDELQVERIIGVEIRSLTPRNSFFKPLSWQVGFGGRRTELDDGKRVLTPYLEGGAGGSWMLGSQLQAIAVATADLEISSALRRGYDLAPGADAGVLYQSPRASLMAGGRTKAWIISSQHRQDEAYLETALHFGRDYSIRAGVSREHHYDRYQTRWHIGFNAFF